jgi:hypothetical protein
LEEQPINTTLTTLHATDVDSTISEYKIIGDNDNGNEYFEVGTFEKQININLQHKVCFAIMRMRAFMFIRKQKSLLVPDF